MPDVSKYGLYEAIIKAATKYADDTTVNGGIILFGEVTTDGSWRIRTESNSMYFDKAISGNWVEQVSIKDTDATLFTKEVGSAGVVKIDNTKTGDNTTGLIIKIAETTPDNDNKFIEFHDGGNQVIGQVDGTGANGVRYTTTSDKRLKDSSGITKYTIDDLMKIKVRDYIWKKHPETGKEIGLFAQELKELIPVAVSNPKNSSWSIDYGRLTPFIIKAVQDLKIENKELKIRIEEIEKKLNS